MQFTNDVVKGLVQLRNLSGSHVISDIGCKPCYLLM